MSVITTFDVLPFFVTICCYAFIWKVAAKICLGDLRIQESVHSNCSKLSKSPVKKLQKSSDVSVTKTVGNNLLVPKMDDVQPKDDLSESDDEDIARLTRRVNVGLKLTASKVTYVVWEMKATRTSFIILLVYLVCWGPLGMLYAIDHYCSNCLSESDEERISLARFIVKTVSLASSFFLPLVYCWRTKEFREESRRIFCRHC